MASHPEALASPGIFRTNPSGVTTETAGPPRPPVVGPKPVFQQISEAFDLLGQRESAARESGDEELAGQFRKKRDEFSAALDKSEQEAARQQAGRQAAEARGLALDRTREEASFRRETLADPTTQKLLSAARRAALLSRVMKGVPSRIQRQIISPTPTGPSVAQQRLDLAKQAELRKAGEFSQRSAERKSKGEASIRLQNQKLNLSREREARLSVSAELNAAFQGIEVDEKTSKQFQEMKERAIERLSKPRLTEEDLEAYEEFAGGDVEKATELAREDGFHVPD